MAPTLHLLSRLKGPYRSSHAQQLQQQQTVPPGPAIHPRSAAALSVLFTLLYVLPFYLSKATRPSPTLSRDAPSSIRARIRAVTFSCVLSALLTILIHLAHGHDAPTTLRQLGWWPWSATDVLKTLLLLCILFAGPLFEAGVVDGAWRDWIRLRYLNETLSSWIGWRNYVAGPFTEEFLWRSCIISLHLLANLSPSTITFLTPLYFGIAHVHHCYEFHLTHPEAPLLVAVLRSLVQFAYTACFGFLAAFVFLRTASLPAVVVAHAFCNWMGLPRFWGRVGVEAAGVPVGPPDGRRRKEDDGDGDGRDRLLVAEGSRGLGWTVAYYVLLVAGAYGFGKCLFPLTESGNRLAVFGAGGESSA